MTDELNDKELEMLSDALYCLKKWLMATIYSDVGEAKNNNNVDKALEIMERGHEQMKRVYHLDKKLKDIKKR